MFANHQLKYHYPENRYNFIKTSTLFLKQNWSSKMYSPSSQEIIYSIGGIGIFDTKEYCTTTFSFQLVSSSQLSIYLYFNYLRIRNCDFLSFSTLIDTDSYIYRLDKVIYDNMRYHEKFV